MKTLTSAVVIFLILGTGKAWAQTSGPTDPQIAAIVVTANQVDINAGKLAKSKADAKDVREFAAGMITDHSRVNKAAGELVARLHVRPEPNRTSEFLRKQGNENLATLKGLSGAAFDKAYLDHEVAYHEAVLLTMDNTLIPRARNPRLKALLDKARPALVAQLEQAKRLQTRLTRSGA